MIFRPLLNGSNARLACVVKRSKPTYRIKTRQTLFRQESLKARLRKPGCLLKDLLQDDSFRISSSLVGHPTIYGKFVIDMHMKAENMQKIYLSADFPVSKSLIY